MQIAPVPVAAEFLAADQQPHIILEMYIPGPGWVSLSALADPITGVLKNYVRDVSFSSGGAKMDPAPMAETFSATISNEGSIFHPNHPTSPYKAYFQAGRKIRIWLGGTYASGKKHWQRIEGVIDEPQFAIDEFELTINGLDYMKALSDIKFTKELQPAFEGGGYREPYTPIDNYWGGLHNISSQATSIFGVQLYAPPGGDAGALLADEAGNVLNWVGGPVPAVIAPAVGTLTAWEIKFDVWVNPRNSSHYNGVCNVVAGTEYSVTFRYARTAGTAGSGKHLRFTLYSVATGAIVGGSGFLDPPTNGVYETCTFSFTPTAADAGALNLHLVGRCFGNAMTWRIDEISIRSAGAPTIVYYAMPAGCTGIYHVLLDGVEQWPGKQKGEGWYYDLGTNRFWFDIDKVVDAGVGNNLFIYYYTAQKAEDVLADILVKAKLYKTRANAITAMGGALAVATGVSIDRVWFKAGETYIKAITMICERCDWRFYSNYDGTPAFVSAPVGGVLDFDFTLPVHVSSVTQYQDRNEIWNKVIIEGEKIAELTGWEENMPSELKDEASDPISIATYGEHTKNITNHLFQSLASITAMCVKLRDAYKDPKWYFDFETPYNAVPLELGDTTRIRIMLDRTLAPATRTTRLRGLIRNIQVSMYNVIFKCQTVGGP